MTTGRHITLVCLLFPVVAGPAFGQTRTEEAVIVRPDEVVSDIVVRGRPLIVLGQVNGSILVLGGDATIEGRVQGGATAIGGSIDQRDGGRIGGDVIVIGGDYTQAPQAHPLDPAAQKVVIREYGEYLREAFQHPWRRLFMPEVTPFYIGQRILGLLFYFLVALLLIALVPSQLSRAIQALERRFSHLALIGLIGALLFFVGVALFVRTVPIEVAASVTLFTSLGLVGAYLFGSLAVQLLVGRWLQRKLPRVNDRSTINALLLGMGAFAILSSVPFLGMLTLLVLVALSFGIAITLPMTRPEGLTVRPTRKDGRIRSVDL